MNTPTLMITVCADDLEGRQREGGITKMTGTCPNGGKVVLITDEDHLGELMKRAMPVSGQAVAMEVPLHTIEGGV